MENKKVPQLRFNIIENEKLKYENWFSAPASEIFISVNDRNHPELPVLSASQELGMIYRDEGGMNIFHDVANEITYKRVKPGQFVIHLRSFQGGFAHSKVEGITSPAYTILDFKDRNKHNDLFWKYVLTSEEFIKRLELITYGIRDGRSINFSDFSTLKFHFPSYEVQLKIGTFLSHVDSLIQAKTKKLESLKAVKKSLLQKCFPKEGEKVPQMRFEGYSGEWEEKKLGEIAEKFDYGLNAAATDFDGKNKYLRITDIDDENRYFKYDDVSSPDCILSESENYLLRENDIVFARTGASVGKTYIYNKQDGIVYFAGFLIRAHIKQEYDSLFIFQNTLSEPYNKYIQITSQRSGQPGVNAEEYKEYSVMCPPTLAEQQKIGQFFSKYDSFISAQQKEIDKLIDIKKSLLQKMFV